MEEQSFVVPLRGEAQGESLVLTPEDALQLILSLREVLRLYGENTERIYEPPLITDGWMSRDSLVDFMSQEHPDESRLGSRVGKLFGRFVQLAADDSSDFEMKCAKCGGTVNAQSCLDDDPASTHTTPNERRLLLVSVRSIKQLTLEHFRRPPRIGPAIVSDFLLLQRNL